MRCFNAFKFRCSHAEEQKRSISSKFCLICYKITPEITNNNPSICFQSGTSSQDWCSASYQKYENGWWSYREMTNKVRLRYLHDIRTHVINGRTQFIYLLFFLAISYRILFSTAHRKSPLLTAALNIEYECGQNMVLSFKNHLFFFKYYSFWK